VNRFAGNSQDPFSTLVAEFSRRQLDKTRNVQLLLTKVQDNMFHSRTHLKLFETDFFFFYFLWLKKMGSIIHFVHPTAHPPPHVNHTNIFT
jgi:hypothetical protein